MDIDYIFCDAARPAAFDLGRVARDNRDFRRVVWTGRHQQLVVMSVADSVPMEVHPDTDQFVVVVAGAGRAVLDGATRALAAGVAVAVPAGTPHGIYNDSDAPLQLYTLYSPPHHPHGLVQSSEQGSRKRETHAVERYDASSDRAEIVCLDKLLFKESADDAFFNAPGYLVRDAARGIASYLLYNVRSPTLLYVASLGTRPDSEGRGLASALLDALKADFPRHAIELKVNTFDDAKAGALIAFYTKRGFAPVYSSTTLVYKPVK